MTECTSVASTKETMLIGRISDIVLSGRGPDFVSWKERCSGDSYAV